MHKQGSTSWFSDGREERETIIKMGEPWQGGDILEIGCGEGDLCAMMINRGLEHCYGNDYSEVAVKKALKKYSHLPITFSWHSYKFHVGPFSRIVMQGVLEHLDDPFGELQWMIEHFKPKTVITSSPCFLNPRGIVWMTLDMLGAVMSKTDLHFLNPWDFEIFCENHGYKLTMQDCDWEWGNGLAMFDDLYERIPLALKDGGLPRGEVQDFIMWLKRVPVQYGYGATMVYRIEI